MDGTGIRGCVRLLWCLVALGGVPAGGEEVPDASPPRVEGLVTSWSWDQGLHYVLEVPALGESAEDGEPHLRPLVRGNAGLRLAVDAGGVARHGDFIDLDQSVDVRRGYFYLDGSAPNVWKPLTFKLEVGFIHTRFSLRNASVTLHEIPYAGTFTAGTFDAPMSLSMVSSSRSTPLMERGLAVEALAPGTKSGFQFANWLAPHRLTWAFGFFTKGDDADAGDSSNAAARAVGRTTWLPWWRSEREFLHVGLSGSYAFSPDQRIRYRSRLESFLAPYVVDTGQIAGSQAFVGGLEALWMLDRLSVQAEQLGATVSRDRGPAPFFHGTYLVTSLFLTPDARRYDQASATFTSLVPSRPLSWQARQLGAFEVALRWSFIDLNDAHVHGGQAGEVTSGLNWYWNRYVRMQFNVGWADVSGGPRPGDYLVLQTRLDLTI